MLDDSFIWDPWPIESIDDIIRFEERYCELVKNAPDEWTPDAGLLPHDFGDGSLCLMGRGHFQRMVQGGIAGPNDVFVKNGCTQIESLILHSFLGFESGIYRKDSYYRRIPPIVNTLCHILDMALDKLPRSNNNLLFRACVYGDREDFTIGEIYEPGYSLTTSADETWRDKSVNRFIITPLKSEHTRARAIYPLMNKANEFQVSFLSDAKFILLGIEDWGDEKKAFLMEEIL